MNAHTRKTQAAILGSPAPRDLRWAAFVTLWEDLADRVDQESGDRLAVVLNGHREVFRRPHDGLVSIEDVERARHLLAAAPEPKGRGHAVAVALDERSARILDFDLDAATVAHTERDVRDHDPRSRHLRTVERHTGNEDEQDLTHYFDDVARTLQPLVRDAEFVVLGHGTGTSNAARAFVERLEHSHHQLARQVAGVADVDLSAASDADLESATERVLAGRG